MPTEARPWFKGSGQNKRVAAINGLGADGAYAHIILSDADEQRRPEQGILQRMPFYLFPVAANDETTLRQRIGDLQTLVRECVSWKWLWRKILPLTKLINKKSLLFCFVGRTQAVLLQEVKMALASLRHALATGDTWKTPNGSYFTPNPTRHSR